MIFDSRMGSSRIERRIGECRIWVNGCLDTVNVCGVDDIHVDFGEDGDDVVG